MIMTRRDILQDDHDTQWYITRWSWHAVIYYKMIMTRSDILQDDHDTQWYITRWSVSTGTLPAAHTPSPPADVWSARVWLQFSAHVAKTSASQPIGIKISKQQTMYTHSQNPAMNTDSEKRVFHTGFHTGFRIWFPITSDSTNIRSRRIAWFQRGHNISQTRSCCPKPTSSFYSNQVVLFHSWLVDMNSTQKNIPLMCSVDYYWQLHRHRSTLQYMWVIHWISSLYVPTSQRLYSYCKGISYLAFQMANFRH